MLSPCYSTTAAAPLLGPSLRRVRATPLARLVIGYRTNSVASCLKASIFNDRSVIDPRPSKEKVCERIGELQKLDRRTELMRPANCGRNLGNALLLDRLLTGGNQNEFLPVLPIMNRRLVELEHNAGNGVFFDAIA